MKLILKNKSDVNLAKKQLDSLIFKTKTGKPITYKFECVKNMKRTLSQNNYYWWCLGMFSKECGHTTDELHIIFKEMFLAEYPDLLDNFITKIEAFGVIKYAEISTTKLNTTVFTKYIEFIRNFAAAEGCYIPEANEVPDWMRF